MQIKKLIQEMVCYVCDSYELIKYVSGTFILQKDTTICDQFSNSKELSVW